VVFEGKEMKEDVIVTILTDVAQEQGIAVNWLSSEEASKLRRLAAIRFGKDADGPITTESLREAIRFNAPETWERIVEFAWNGPVVLFTNPRDSVAMLRVASLKNAIDLLAEAPPFDFLLGEPEFSFLFAHDQYDNLLVCGDARELIEATPEEK
jgi:hypothetical protein